jgi:hypothetical protein
LGLRCPWQTFLPPSFGRYCTEATVKNYIERKFLEKELCKAAFSTAEYVVTAFVNPGSSGVVFNL